MLRPDANVMKERGTNTYSGKGVDFYTYFESVGKSMRMSGGEPLERGAQYDFQILKCDDHETLKLPDGDFKITGAYWGSPTNYARGKDITKKFVSYVREKNYRTIPGNEEWWGDPWFGTRKTLQCRIAIKKKVVVPKPVIPKPAPVVARPAVVAQPKPVVRPTGVSVPTYVMKCLQTSSSHSNHTSSHVRAPTGTIVMQALQPLLHIQRFRQHTQLVNLVQQEVSFKQLTLRNLVHNIPLNLVRLTRDLRFKQHTRLNLVRLTRHSLRFKHTRLNLVRLTRHSLRSPL